MYETAHFMHPKSTLLQPLPTDPRSVIWDHVPDLLLPPPS